MKSNRYHRPSRSLNLRRLLPVLTLLVAGGLLYGYLRDIKAPEIRIEPPVGLLSLKVPLKVLLQDSGSGLKSVKILARQGGSELVLTEKGFSGESSAEIIIDKGLEILKDGEVDFTVEVRDQSYFPFGRGNRALSSFKKGIDRQPPRIDLLSDSIPLWQGGAATIVYKVSEETSRSGVTAGEHFFPGYRQSDGRYLCIVPFPVEETAVTYHPRLIAVDAAGNETSVSPGLRLIARKFPNAKINVSDAFIAAKTEEFQSQVPGVSGVELFLQMNRDIRGKNRKALIELAAKTSPVPLWSQPMLRMPRAKTTGDYAEARDYFYNGRLVDHQTHLGTDLASVAQAPILAANPGKVVYAGYFGIYGGCVIIDHGLGVLSLYGHMSSLSAQVGQTVTRGEEIGRSGKTGMSGGDHLHFEVIVSGVPVRPEEWMEEKWMATNILGAMK